MMFKKGSFRLPWQLAVRQRNGDFSGICVLRTLEAPFYCDYTFKTNKDCGAHSNLAEPESTSQIFILKFLIIWSLLEGV